MQAFRTRLLSLAALSLAALSVVAASVVAASVVAVSIGVLTLSTGIRAAAAATRPPAAALGPGQNSVSAFGAAANLGPAQPLHLNEPLVGLAARHDGSGYWLTAADGGIFNYGSASFMGSMAGSALNSPVVGIAAAPDGGGYWLVASDGGIFNFGSARFYGSMGGTPLNAPIVGIAAAPDGGGYWLVASDGGVFAFGSARFHGSIAGTPLNAPVVGIAATPRGGGYWLAGADGGVFNYGDAGFLGSPAAHGVPAGVAGIAAASDGSGYWLAGKDGRVYAFGTPGLGDATAGVPGTPPVVGIAPLQASGYWLLEGDSADDYSMSPGPGLAVVQQRLEDLGYWDGGPTGSMNDATTQAIWAFQKYEHLPPTGTLDAGELVDLANTSRPQAPGITGDAIVVEKGPDLVFLVQHSSTVWVFNTSTGGGYTYTSGGVTSVAVTPDGTFHIQYGINGWHTSPLGQMWRPRFFVGGYALHGDTYVPAVPVSHGCVRVSIEAMDFIWDNHLAPIGEMVSVSG